MEQEGKLKLGFPSQGWQQIHTARKEMLSAFDAAKEKGKKHEVEVYHGKVAEAEFRSWLSSFLPRRYAVSSGYIVSQGLDDTNKTPHFDVIIYDALESPVLWVEDNPDLSSAGKSLAIPCEHVKAVLEIKSRFSNKTATDGINHLGELAALMSGIDAPQERYKLYLPLKFFCGMVFFELLKKDARSRKALNEMVQGISLRGFAGGMILRGEGHLKEMTAKIDLLRSEREMKTDLERKHHDLLKGFCMADSLKVKDDLHFGAMLMWAEPNFAQFSFDLIARLQGTHEPGRLSSFYGIGTTEWAEEAKRKRAEQVAGDSTGKR
jgi:hypothetical protein